ncbi:MAG TPA: Hpt domain-containing protein [Methylovirgula sp.]
MSSDLDALWNEFAAETEEHLDALERMLSERSAEGWSRDAIAALFRYFHSLKGTFLAMGFTNVEAVAHCCEDVLSLVREGKSPLDPPLVQTLLRAVDRLKGMREDVIGTRKDATPARDIIADLETHGAHRRDEAPNTESTPRADVPLAEDPEMLNIYSELLDQRLPQLRGALAAEKPARAAAKDAADTLAYGAEMMGFEAIAGTLRGLSDLSASDDGRERNAIVALLLELREQVKVIEEVTNTNAGSASFSRALANSLGSDYTASLNRLAAALGEEPDSVVSAAQASRALAAGLGYDESARILLLIEERFRGPEALGSAESVQFAALAIDALEVIGTAARSGADLSADNASRVAGRFTRSFHTPGSTDLALVAVEQRLGPEMLSTLSNQQRARLEQALIDGRRAYEVLLELERHREIADDIIAWLSTSVETITSRTVARDGVNCFEFLILSEHAVEWITGQLAALDPERVCLRSVTDLNRGTETAPSEPSAPGQSVRAPLIRVRSETIDELMAEIGDMRGRLARLADILQQGRIAQVVEAGRRSHAIGRDPLLQEQLDAMEDDLRELRDLEQSLEATHRRVWTAGLQLRVVPVDGLFGRLSRAARDVAEKLGKDIDVVIDGREVRIDKSMVDGLIDPLMHMVRNAVDHGIESRERRIAQGKSSRGRLSISAFERGNHIDIVIADDGRGLDRVKILAKAVDLGILMPEQAEQIADSEVSALIFHPGFSTADTVTEISGRGVGLDVVAATLHRLGGTIDVQSVFGSGTTFSLRLPLSASLLRALLIEVDGQIFALPERQVVNVLEIDRELIESSGDRRIVLHRGAAVPVQHLASALGFPMEPHASGLARLVIVTTGTETLGLEVDRILRFQDLFLKELHPILAASPLIGGASVLGDGRPVLVLEARGFATLGHDEASDKLKADAAP